MSLEIAGVPSVAGKSKGVASLPKRASLAKNVDRPTVDGDLMGVLSRPLPRPQIQTRAAGCTVEAPEIIIKGPKYTVAQTETKEAGKAEKVEAVSAGSTVPADMVVDFRGGHNGIRATLLDGGLIKMEEEVKTNWSSINKTKYPVPKGAKFLVVEILGGKWSEIGAEDKHGMKLQLGESPSRSYPDYVKGSKGKHYFKIPKKLAGKTAPQLQLMFAPGKISAGAQMKVYFSKSK